MAHHSSQATPSAAARQRSIAREVDWGAVFFSLYEQLERRAHKRFHHAPDAEAAFQHALDAISAERWAVARGTYRGKGSPEGFLATCFGHRLEEYARGKWGRLHVPAWVRRQGALHTAVFKRCVQGESAEAILAALATDDDCETVREAIRNIKARVVTCGVAQGEVHTESPPDIAGDSETMEDLEEAMLLDAVCALTGEAASSSTPEAHAPPAVAAAATAAMAGILRDLPARATLSERQRLILRLRLRDGYAFRRIGETVGCSRKMAERAYSATLEQLRGAFRGCAP